MPDNMHVINEDANKLINIPYFVPSALQDNGCVSVCVLVGLFTIKWKQQLAHKEREAFQMKQ